MRTLDFDTYDGSREHTGFWYIYERAYQRSLFRYVTSTLIVYVLKPNMYVHEHAHIYMYTKIQ